MPTGPPVLGEIKFASAVQLNRTAEVDKCKDDICGVKVVDGQTAPVGALLMSNVKPTLLTTSTKTTLLVTLPQVLLIISL